MKRRRIQLLITSDCLLSEEIRFDPLSLAISNKSTLNKIQALHGKCIICKMQILIGYLLVTPSLSMLVCGHTLLTVR